MASLTQHIGFFPLFGTSITVIIARCLYLRYFHPLAVYPGPFLASFTNLWRFWTFWNGKQHLVDQNLHKKYGDVVRDGPNSLLFSDLDAYMAIYGFNKGLEKGGFYAMAGDPDPQKASIFSARTDEQHRERRRAVAPTLSSFNSGVYETLAYTNVLTMLEKLDEARESNDGAINIASHIHRFTFDTMYECIHGESMGFQVAGYDKNGCLAAQRHVTKLTFSIPLIEWLSKIFTSKLIWSGLQKPRIDSFGHSVGMTAISEMSRDIVFREFRKYTPESPLRSSILRSFLDVAPDNPRRMDEEAMWRECFNLVFAGPGSVAAALTSALYDLGTHPSWQDRILTEYRSTNTTPTASKVGLHVPDTSLIPLTSIKALQAFLKESLRYSPPFPSAFPRYIAPGAEESIPCLSTPLPVGTKVASNIYAICRNKEVFGENADEWNPHRWLVLDPRKDHEKLKRMEDANAIFGRGARGCIGKEIAWLLLCRAIIAILEKWEVRAPEGGLKGRNAFEMQYEELWVELKARE